MYQTLRNRFNGAAPFVQSRYLYGLDDKERTDTRSAAVQAHTTDRQGTRRIDVGTGEG